VQERLLLDAFSKRGEAREFGGLDGATKRVIGRLLQQIVPDREPSGNTTFALRSEAQFTLSVPGTSVARTISYPLGGPSNTQLVGLAKSPLVAKKPDQKTAIQRRSSAELLDNLKNVKLEWRAEVYRLCTAKINEQVRIELSARQEALKRALSALGNAPDGSWSKGDIDEKHLKNMERAFVSGWRVYGFESQSAAQSAWNDGSISNARVSFTLMFGDDVTHQGSPVIGGIEIGGSAR
jgi:hypothetical protein